ncbi:MAG: hypothetical protein J7L58_04215, partial [Thermoplasmata archaeon]|nr:hypothetical protein [Thermoplasmata archaeon]
ECKHYIEYYAIDALGNNESGLNWEGLHNQTVYIDNTPPTSHVEIISPYKQNHVPFIITATAVDAVCSGGCGVDHVELWYRHSTDNSTWSNWILYGIDYNTPYQWQFYAPNGSGYYEFCSVAVDNLGNRENTPISADAKCRVMNAPPITTKHHGQPFYSVGGRDYISPNTEFNFTVVDPDGNSSNATIKYRWWWNGIWTQWINYTGNFTIYGECKHYLEYYAIDEDGNIEATHNQTYYLDATPPDSQLNVGNLHYNKYVNESTQFTITATDYGCNGGVGVKEIRYRINGGAWHIYTGPFTLSGQCQHTIEWYAIDNLGNEESHHSDIYYVDTTPPTSSLYLVGENSGNFVNTNTIININATDVGGSCDVGSWKIHWRVWYDGSWHGWHEGDWNSVVSVKFTEECIHYIEWYAEDRVGNIESIHNRTFYVDNTPPDTTFIVHGSNVSGGTFIWINYSSYITLNAIDHGCNGGVGVEKTYFRYVFNGISHPTGSTDNEYGTPVNIDGTWYWVWVGEQSQKIKWNEDCIHTLYYYSVDKLTNKETLKHVTFYVDNTPPSTSNRLKLTGYSYTSGGNTWVTTSTSFYFDLSSDPDNGCNGGVGLDKIKYRIWYDTDNDGNFDDEIIPSWIDYTAPFHINEECHHKIEWYGIDKLGNEETHNFKEIYVDDTPPISSETIGEPKWPESGANEGRWVTTDTQITITATDDGECAINSWRIHWEIWLNGAKISSGVGNWDTPVVIKFNEACNHTLKWWAEDRLNNKESIHSQYYYVDITPPATSNLLQITGDKFTSGGNTWATTSTSFYFDLSSDPDNGCNGGVGLDKIKYRIWYDTDNDGNFESTSSWHYRTTSSPFHINEECHHKIEWYGIDKL